MMYITKILVLLVSMLFLTGCTAGVSHAGRGATMAQHSCPIDQQVVIYHVTTHDVTVNQGGTGKTLGAIAGAVFGSNASKFAKPKHQGAARPILVLVSAVGGAYLGKVVDQKLFATNELSNTRQVIACADSYGNLPAGLMAGLTQKQNERQSGGWRQDRSKSFLEFQERQKLFR